MAEGTIPGPAPAVPGGGSVSIESLVRDHGRAVLAVCLAGTRNHHDAEDAAQEVFVKAFRKLGTLRDAARARAWLVRIARRSAIDVVRRRRPAAAIPADIPAPEMGPDPHLAALEDSLGRLPRSDREVLSLYYLDGRSCETLARGLGIKAPAARQRLARARLRLQEILEEETP